MMKVLSRQTSQEVCPHNSPKLVQITSEEAFRPREGVHGERLIELTGMDPADGAVGALRGRREVEKDPSVREENVLVRPPPFAVVPESRVPGPQTPWHAIRTELRRRKKAGALRLPERPR